MIASATVCCCMTSAGLSDSAPADVIHRFKITAAPTTKRTGWVVAAIRSHRILRALRIQVQRELTICPSPSTHATGLCGAVLGGGEIDWPSPSIHVVGAAPGGALLSARLS